MGSKRLITVFLVCLFVYGNIKNAEANLQEERREYQYQRSSKVVGGSGYYNSRTGKYEELGTDVDGWTQSQKDQVQGMAEKLRSELSSAQPGYGQGCKTICTVIPGFIGKTQEEIDVIAKDMTSQIIADLKSGKLARSQMNQPNWYEHQVENKLIELSKLHQEQHQQNVFRASSRFRENESSQSHPSIYTGSNTYNKDIEDLQQQQQNIFTDEDLRQIQQNVFDQRQHQQQGHFYQQQSQNQHTLYTRPGNRYYNSQTNSRDSANEEGVRTVYPTPVVTTNNVREEKNFTSSSSTAVVPPINIFNQYGHRDEEEEDRQYTQSQTIPTVIPNYDRSYYAQKEYEERHSSGYRPRPRPLPTTSQTIQTGQTTTYEREHTIPVVTPTQRTVTTSNVQVEQEEKQVRQQPQYPRIYDREEKTQESETYHRNRQNVVRPTQRTTYETHNTEQEERIVEVYTPSPVPVTGSKHSIYDHVKESEVVPNYQPRVVIDKNTEFEVLDHRKETNYRPQVPQVVTETRTINQQREEEERCRQHIILQRPTQTTCNEQHHVVEEKVVTPVTPRYVSGGISEHVIASETEENRTSHRQQYPIRTAHGQTTERNQSSIYTISRRYPSQPIYPSFKSNTTIFENGDSYILSESHIPTSYVIDLTVEEYEERLHRLKNELIRLGYGRLTDEEYNATIATGGFRHNGYTYVYNASSRRFEKTSSLSESHIPTSVVIDLTVEEYEERLHRLRNELIRLGYGRLTDEEYNATIATGRFKHNGYIYVYNASSGRFEKTNRIDVNNEEYEVIYGTLQQKLREIGFGDMCDQEVKQTITTGVFIRDGSKFVYNSMRENYDQIEITEQERRIIFNRIQELLRRLGYRLLTQKENEGVLINGYFIRAAHQWIYNSVDGTVEKTIYVGDFAEFTDDEYREIYRKIQDTLSRIGYAQMTDSQCNATITSGTFERGGIYWSYNPNSGDFERILLSQEEYRDRLNTLRQELKRLRHRELSAEEYRKIIYQGYFHHGGYRYEYVKDSRRYDRIEMSAAEYQERLQQLRQQLRRIGYGTMSESLCNSTITSGIFHYGGYEWVYNFETKDYQMGNRSNIDPTVNGNDGQNTANLDTTKYNSTKPAEGSASTGHGTAEARRNRRIFSDNRGDQPPQHFEEDYESDEFLEEEPGMGYYPTGKKPEIGLATPETFDQIRETTVIPTTTQPRYVPPTDYISERERQRYEKQTNTQTWPAQPEQTVSERRYHRTQSSYTQTTGLLPQQLATQRSMRHVPGGELESGNTIEPEDRSTPFEPEFVSTEAYLVGNERPYNPNDQSGIIERYLRNEKQRSPVVPDRVQVHQNNHQREEDIRLQSENLEDLGQQYDDFNGQHEDFNGQHEDFNGQHEEDVQQQLIDLNEEAADLRQQQVDVNQYDNGNHQRMSDNYAMTREYNHQNAYNSHYHGEKETAHEYEAEVVPVTDKADKQNEESPGLWKRLTDKTKDIFG